MCQIPEYSHQSIEVGTDEISIFKKWCLTHKPAHNFKRHTLYPRLITKIVICFQSMQDIDVALKQAEGSVDKDN